MSHVPFVIKAKNLPFPIEQSQNQRAQQTIEHIFQCIEQAEHIVSFKEKIQDVLIKFPKDDRCPCGGEGEKDLNRKRNLAEKFLRIADGGTVKISDRDSTKEVRWDIQRWIQVKEMEGETEEVKTDYAQWRPGGLA